MIRPPRSERPPPLRPSDTEFAQWALSASRYPGVDWVYTHGGLFRNGGLVTESGPESASIDTRTAIVSPSETARSELTQSTVKALDGIDAPAGVTLEGLAVDAEASGTGAGATLWVVVGLLALTSGFTVIVLIGDLGLAVVAIALRLLTTAALLGSYSIVVGDATAAELQVVMLVVSVGIALFEVGMLRSIVETTEPPDGFVTVAMRSGGGHAVLGLLAVAFAGLGLLASDLDGDQRIRDCTDRGGAGRDPSGRVAVASGDTGRAGSAGGAPRLSRSLGSRPAGTGCRPTGESGMATGRLRACCARSSGSRPNPTMRTSPPCSSKHATVQ